MTPPPTTPTPRLNMGELMPCPFCGHAAKTATILTTTVCCSHCKARGPLMPTGEHTFETARDHDTVTAWNTRPRTEGRGEGEPVAWRTRFLSRDRWDFSSDADQVSALVKHGYEVQPLYASPIREPEISREAVSAAADLIVRNVNEYDDRTSPEDWPEALLITSEELHAELMDFADAILNLAPVGGRGAVSASDRAFVRHLIREMRSAIADDPNDATITTGPLDPDILERVLNVALGAQDQGGG